jgi:hypothetical protein
MMRAFVYFGFEPPLAKGFAILAIIALRNYSRRIEFG